MEIETVDEHCKHEDCCYRFLLTHGYRAVHYCDYIGVEGKPRGCKISECDKYRKGRRRCKLWEFDKFEWSIDDDFL